MSRKTFARFLVVVVSVGYVPVVRAAVIVNEVAWMGTTVSASDEWIELANTGATSVDLSGWSLLWDSDSVSPKRISLSGAIAAGSYFILERTDDSSAPSVAADLIYTGGLDNGGETLSLMQGSTTMQVIDASDGWPAGDNTTKETMQWNGSAWAAAAPTPRAANGVSAETPASEQTPPVAQSPAAGGGISSHASPAPLRPIAEERPPTVSAGRDRRAAVGESVHFEATGIASGESFMYEWSFGDGASARGRETTHTYAYPGIYQVVLNAARGESRAVARAKVFIFEPSVSITEIGTAAGDQFIAVRNAGAYEINMAGWTLRSVGASFTFPDDTIIGSKQTVLVPQTIHRISFTEGRSVILARSDGRIAHATEQLSEKAPALKNEPSLSGVKSGLAEAVRAVEALSKRIAERVPQKVSLSATSSAHRGVPVAALSSIPASSVSFRQSAASASATAVRRSLEVTEATSTPSRIVIPKRESGFIGLVSRISRFLGALLPGS